MFGSRTAIAAILRSVRRVYLYKSSAAFNGLPFKSVNELSNGRVLSFPCHSGAGEELRLEILTSDSVTVPTHFDSPLVGRVLALRGATSFEFAVLAQRFLVSTGLLRATFVFLISAGHAPLDFSQPFLILVFVGPERHVKVRAFLDLTLIVNGHGGRGFLHSPVDTYDATRIGRIAFWRGFDHERRKPFAVGLSVNPDTGRRGWEFPRPHHGDYCSLGELQPERVACIYQPEPADTVVQCRLRAAATLIVRQSSTNQFLVLAVKERFLTAGAEIPHDLLLGNA